MNECKKCHFCNDCKYFIVNKNDFKFKIKAIYSKN